MEKKKLNTRALIPVVTAIVAIVFIAVGMIDFGFWDAGPTPGFFPIIIAVVLLLASIASFIQVARDKDGKDVQYNRAELMVILGAAGIIIGSMVIGLILSCLVYLVLWLKLVEHAPWKHVIIIEAILAAIIIGVFVVWLQVQFPTGLFELFM